MKISNLVSFVFLMHVMFASVMAATFDRNSVKGLWHFNGNLNPHWMACQQPLTTPGMTIEGLFGPRFVTAKRKTYLDLRSDSAPYAGLKSYEFLRVENPVGPNGPANATSTNSWTLVMDVRIPASSGTIALVQNSTDTSSTEIFLNSNRQIVFASATGPSGANPVASGVIATSTWVRLAFTSSYNSILHRNILKAYVNGNVTTESSGGTLWATSNGNYGLATAFALFSGPAGTTAPIEINGLGFWGRALSAVDIADIGDPNATGDNGIDWSGIIPANGWPRLPSLTGILKFGEFETEITTDMAALSASATAPAATPPVAIAEVEVTTGTWALPGMP